MFGTHSDHKPEGCGKGKTRIRLVGLLAPLLVISLIVGSGVYFVARFVLPGSTDLRTVSSVTFIRFPVGARLERSQLMRGPDYGLYAKVLIDRADVNRFVSSLPSKPAPIDPPFAVGTPPTWWNPDSARTAHGLEIDPGIAQGRINRSRVVVTLDDRRTSVVYIDWVGTPPPGVRL